MAVPRSLLLGAPSGGGGGAPLGGAVSAGGARSNIHKVFEVGLFLCYFALSQISIQLKNIILKM